MPKHDKESNLNAGLLTEEDGMDANTRAAIEQRLAPREPSIVGNLADLQRAGGLIATGQATRFADGVAEINDKNAEKQLDGSKSDSKAAAKASDKK